MRIRLLRWGYKTMPADYPSSNPSPSSNPDPSSNSNSNPNSNPSSNPNSNPSSPRPRLALLRRITTFFYSAKTHKHIFKTFF